jgi:factor associated with neutral sphingomyelinase activation
MVKDSLAEFSSSADIFKKYTSLIGFQCKQVVEMKDDNKNHPYNFVKNDGKEKFIFSLKFISVEDFNHKVNPIFYLWKHGKTKSDIYNELKQDFDSKKQHSSFDLTQVEDFREQKIKEIVGFMVSPLSEVPGRIYLTNQRIYFQAYYNIGSSTPVQKYALKDLIRVVKRRYVMRQIGIEFFTQSTSIFICVRT